MSQLEKLRLLLENPPQSDAILQYYLDSAFDIICDIRNSNKVEAQYLTTQIRIAIEMFNKMGAEGETGHSENGISRSYEAADVSPSLINSITPVVKTPFGGKRVVE